MEATKSRTVEGAFVLTPSALEQVKKKLARPGQEARVLAVRVVKGGCSGMGYDLNLVGAPKPDDLTWEQDGVTVATDPDSVKYLTGTQVDYAKSEFGGAFMFRNPNAKSSCGCGTSFSS